MYIDLYTFMRAYICRFSCSLGIGTLNHAQTNNSYTPNSLSMTSTINFLIPIFFYIPSDDIIVYISRELIIQALYM